VAGVVADASCVASCLEADIRRVNERRLEFGCIFAGVSSAPFAFGSLAGVAAGAADAGEAAADAPVGADSAGALLESPTDTTDGRFSFDGREAAADEAEAESGASVAVGVPPPAVAASAAMSAGVSLTDICMVCFPWRRAPAPPRFAFEVLAKALAERGVAGAPPAPADAPDDGVPAAAAAADAGADIFEENVRRRSGALCSALRPSENLTGRCERATERCTVISWRRHPAHIQRGAERSALDKDVGR
jgi:hypothetical protein